MEIKEIQKKFSENVYQNYDILNKELNDIYKNVCKSIKNNYGGLLYSNTRKINSLKKLNSEEIFLMNVPDKIILAILNISIYESILENDYGILCNGVFTYSRFRNLNRFHLEGFSLCNCIESFILDDKVLLKKSK
jgi:hypothetical protein